VHCHGGGALQRDTTPTVNRTPAWSGQGQFVCGACHGAPPADGLHDARWGLAECHLCHPASIDASGALVPARHADGVIDVR
jgi:predicted CxxxxCH...CXXCH cytochrome family protein